MSNYTQWRGLKGFFAGVPKGLRMEMQKFYHLLKSRAERQPETATRPPIPPDVPPAA